MLPRCFIFFGVFALFAAIMCISAQEVEVEDLEDRETNPAVKIVAKYIGSLLTGAAVSCLSEAAYECASYWKQPAASITCAKNYLAVNKGRCAVGK